MDWALDLKCPFKKSQEQMPRCRIQVVCGGGWRTVFPSAEEGAFHPSAPRGSLLCRYLPTGLPDSLEETQSAYQQLLEIIFV